MIRATVLLSMGLALPALAQDNPAARFRTMSAPDCASAASIIAEAADAPTNRTYLRVQHMGDPGTPELEGEVANVVTWDVGSRTGYFPSSMENAQRGYRDVTGDSAFQLGCAGAGFHIDTSRFSHAAPLVGEGPSASIARDFAPSKYLFSDGSSLMLEATVALPTSATASPPMVDGTAQLSFFYYARDEVSGAVFAHLVALYDNRPWGTVGSESVGSDGVTAFISSPLSILDTAGAPMKYVTVGPGSATMRTVEGWSTPAVFRAVVTQPQFEAMLARLRAGPMPQLSPRPANYRVLSFGILGEVFPGTGTANEVALGGSVFDLALRESPAGPLIVR
jgi:hypothetical protein